MSAVSFTDWSAVHVVGDRVLNVIPLHFSNGDGRRDCCCLLVD